MMLRSGSAVSERLRLLLAAMAALALVAAAALPAETKPTGLTGTVANDSVTLARDDPDDSTITGYQILRPDKSKHAAGFVVLIDDTQTSARSHVDTYVEAAAEYVYRVKARNHAGLGPRSNFVNAKIPATPAHQETQVEVIEADEGDIAADSVPKGVIARSGHAPAITSSDTFTIDEGTTAVAKLTATDGDTDEGDLEWSKTGGADADEFTLSVDGGLVFAAANDFEDPDDHDADGVYEVSVQVSDGSSTDSADLSVTLSNVIELTAFDGPAAVTYTENGAGRVATFTASSDADRAGIKWAVSGTDATHFSIDNPAGALRFEIDSTAANTFLKPPDFEDPDDAGGDNVYQLSLSASDGLSTSSPFAVTVTVTDADENGTITLSAKRPAKGSLVAGTLTDPDGVTGTVAWVWERSTGSQRLGRDRRRDDGQLHTGCCRHERVSAGDCHL